MRQCALPLLDMHHTGYLACKNQTAKRSKDDVYFRQFSLSLFTADHRKQNSYT